MADNCPTCVLLDALLASRGLTKGERAVAYSEPVRRTDRKVRKRTGVALKGMKSALKKANAKARKKNGSFKKGWTQARVMKEAHRIRRRS
jgi:hypothetical protein